MKKIGFIDYYIDEWHANNYPAWIQAAAEKTGSQFKLSYVWAELDKAPEGMTTDGWCEKFGVKKCADIAELCAKSDYVIILAPSNPEKHLEYAKQAFKYGKRTYIDKTFTPNYAEALEIDALAQKNGVQYFSTSALRYAAEITPYKNNANSVILTGGGGSFEEYIIHQLEMLVSIMGTGATGVKITARGSQVSGAVIYPNGRAGVINYSQGMPFSVSVTDKQGNSAYLPIQSDFFAVLIERILDFFKTGKIDFAASETLEIMKIREALINAAESGGEQKF